MRCRQVILRIFELAQACVAKDKKQNRNHDFVTLSKSQSEGLYMNDTKETENDNAKQHNTTTQHNLKLQKGKSAMAAFLIL